MVSFEKDHKKRILRLFLFSFFALACTRIFIKRTVLKLDLLMDRKIYCLKACAACTFESPELFRAGAVKGLNLKSFSDWSFFFFFPLFFFFFFLAKHIIVGLLFRNIHPSLQYSSH